MKEPMRRFGALTLGVLCSLLLGVPQFPVQASEPPTVSTGELLAPDATLPDPECDPPAEAPRLDLQPPAATPASGSSGSFYVCFDDSLLCGECPSGTHCATEACGSTLNPHCTFQFSCVTSCIVTNCTFIGTDCRDF